MSVGRCASCGEVTGEVVPEGTPLQQAYCQFCEPVQYTPTRRHLRINQDHNPFVLNDPPPPTTFTWLHNEGEAPTTFTMNNVRRIFDEAVGETQDRPVFTYNEFGALECPSCGSSEWEWSGEAVRRELVDVRYATEFWGTIERGGTRIYEDYENHDTLRENYLETEIVDTTYNQTARCCNCGYQVAMADLEE